jgi:hypothetical protein
MYFNSYGSTGKYSNSNYRHFAKYTSIVESSSIVKCNSLHTMTKVSRNTVRNFSTERFECSLSVTEGNRHSSFVSFYIQFLALAGRSLTEC